MVKEKFQHEGTGHDWWHIYRVWQMAKRIAREEKDADLETVELAALLHDIADWKEHGGDLTAGPREARNWLEQHRAPENQIAHICDIIARSSYKGAGVKDEMPSIEGKIVQDADRLDAIGAIGIARTFAYSGSKGRLIYDPEKPPTPHQNFDEYKKNTSSTINHFHEKLLLLKDRMHTATAKKIAQERHEYMQDYLKRFQLEWDALK